MKPPRILVRPSGDSGPPDDRGPVRVPGEMVRGTVTAMEADDVLIDLEGGGAALVPAGEYSSLPTVGDTVEARYLIDDRSSGKAILTTREPIAQVDSKKVKPGAFVVGDVVEAGKPGLRVRCGETTGFFPVSQLPPGLLRDPGRLLRKSVAGFVTAVRRGEMTLSLRTVLDGRARRATTRRISSFREGSKVQGTIVRATDFGLFVDLGGIDGLLHVSRVEHHNEQRKARGEDELALETGQPIEVVVRRVEAARGRIGLDLPDLDDESGDYSMEEQDSDSEVTGILRKIGQNGAVVYLEGGVEGWLATERFSGQSPREGELRRFRVLSQEGEGGRVELTLRLRGSDEDDDEF